MRPFKIILFVLFAVQYQGYCADVDGMFTAHINREIKLFVYDGLERIKVASMITDRYGRFHLNCPIDYIGMGYLEIADVGRLELVLDKSDIKLKGRNILETDRIKFRNSEENRLYCQFLADHKRRDDLLLELHDQLYQSSKNESHGGNKDKSFFSDQIKKSVRKELDFINGLDKSTYISWYIPSIRFIHDMTVQSKYNPSFVPFFVEDFRRLDLTDKRLVHSGIYCALLEGHFALLENADNSREEVHSAMCQSINYIINSLEGRDDKLLAQIDAFLAIQLKKNGFDELSRYLTMAILTKNNNKTGKHN